MNVLVFHLFAGAYLNPDDLEKCLSHACEVDADGYPVRVLCGRVAVDNVCADVVAEGEATCKTCAARARKLAAPPKSRPSKG